MSVYECVCSERGGAVNRKERVNVVYLIECVYAYVCGCVVFAWVIGAG